MRYFTTQNQNDSIAGWFPVLLLPLLVLCSGCVAGNYRYGLQREGSIWPATEVSRPSMTVGGSSPRLDRVERFVKSPRRWFSQVAGRDTIDPSTQPEYLESSAWAADQYLSVNGLSNVQIEVRAYDPKRRWQRLVQNQQIAPVWKYSAGTISWLRYTLLPPRVFGTDRYDPFSNSLDINSGSAASAIYESAQAKVFYRERMIGPGAYATLQYVPAVPIVHHVQVANDALSYSQHHLSGSLNREMFPLSHSRVGASVVFETFSIFGPSTDAPVIAGLAARGTGALVGRSLGQQRYQE